MSEKKYEFFIHGGDETKVDTEDEDYVMYMGKRVKVKDLQRRG